MIKIGILGDIGSGKSYVAQNFGYPVFNADSEVAKLYKKDKKIFNKLKKILPKYIHTFPVEKKEISNAILAQKNNLTKIIKIVHLEIRKKMNIFLKKHNKAKFIKDMSSETPDAETFIFVKDNISKYQLNIDINSKALKNKMIEINTIFKFEDKEKNQKKSYFEINFATIVKIDDEVKEKKGTRENHIM